MFGREVHALAERVAVGPEAAREVFVDDQHARAALDVIRVEEAAG